MVGRKAVTARSVHPGLLSYRSGNGRVESLSSLSLSFICVCVREKKGQRSTEGGRHLALWCIRVCMSVHVIFVCTDILSVLSALSPLVSFFSYFVYLLSFIITPTVLPSGHVSCNSRVTCAAGTDLHKSQTIHSHTHTRDKNCSTQDLQVTEDLFTWVGICGWKIFCWLSALIETVVVVMVLVARCWLGVLVLGLADPGWLAADLESVSLPKARIAFSGLRDVRTEKISVSALDFVLLQLALCLTCVSMSCL